MKKRLLSLLLVLVMLLGMVPVSALAAEADDEEPVEASVVEIETDEPEETPEENELTVLTGFAPAAAVEGDGDAPENLPPDEDGDDPPAGPTVASIAVKTGPTKTEYTVGDTVDAAGLVITVTYSDETTADVAEGFTFSDLNCTEAGTKTVTVTYGTLTATFDVTVKEAEVWPKTGECGTSLTWSLSEDGVLTISGEGAMPSDWTTDGGAPWFDYRSQISEVIIQEGVTNIARFAFGRTSGEDAYTNLSKVSIPSTIADIGIGAFQSCGLAGSLTIPETVMTLGNNAFRNTQLEELVIDCDISSNFPFADNANLKRITVNGVISGNGSRTGVSIFQNCTSLEEVVFGGNVTLNKTSSGSTGWMFGGCSALKRIIIKTSVSEINGSSFRNDEVSVFYEGSEAEWQNVQVTSLAQTVTFLGEEPPVPVAVSIAVSGTYKTEYEVGDTFDPTGIIVTATMSEGEPQDVTASVTFSGFDSENAGEKTVTVTYGTLTATFDVTVKEAANTTIVAEGECGENVTYKLTSDGVLTISGNGAMADYTTSVRPTWEAYRTQIISLVVESGVTKIGDYAFYRNASITYGSLVNIILSDTVESIGERTFLNCSAVTNMDLPASLTSIGAYAFNNVNNIATISYGGNEVGWSKLSADFPQLQNAQVTCRGGRAVSIAITGQKTEYALYEHLTLEGAAITVTLDNGESAAIDARYVTIAGDTSAPGETAVTLSFNDTSVQYTITVSDQIGEVGSGTCGAEDDGENVTWRLTTDGKLVISGTGAMADFAAESAQPWYAGKSYISEVIVNPGVTTVGAHAFSYCANLTTVSLPDTLTSIGDQAFYSTTLREINIPVNVVSVGSYAFGGTDTLIYDSAAYIGNVLGSVTHLIIGPHAKEYPTLLVYSLRSSLQSLEIDENNPYITQQNGMIFSDEGRTLSAVTGTFSGELVIPEGVTKIVEYAAKDITAVTSVVFPSSLLEIGPDAFGGCTGITSISELPASLRTIGKGAFYQCSGLTGTVIIPASVTEFGGTVFSGCSSLEGVIFEGTLEALDSQVFYNCSTLQTVQLPQGLKTLDTGVFSGCSALESVALPDTLTSIGNQCFQNSGLRSMYFPGSITSFGNMLFYGCTSLTRLELGEGITTTGASMTSRCSSLSELIIPASLTSYNDSHSGCTSLTQILYRGTEEQWNAITFSSAAARAVASRTIVYNYDPSSVLAVTVTQQPEGASYAWGEVAAPLELKAQAEEGVSLSYTWYVNDTESTEGGRALEYSVDTEGGSSLAVYYDAPGTYYYYCLISAAKESAVIRVYSDVAAIEITGEAGTIALTGNGTAESPWQIGSAEDLVKVSNYARAGHDFAGEYLKLTADITLPDNWEPIGFVELYYRESGSISGWTEVVTRPFSGIIDGCNYTVTVPEGGLPLLGYIGPCSVKNLKIFGTRIAGPGLINFMPVLGPSGTVNVENVTLLSGSSTRSSGIVNGGGRSSFVIRISGCTVESGVTIGYDHSQSNIGSFAGGLCGAVENCVSYADVYGVNNVGGLVGYKAQSMSAFGIYDSQFHGTVNASGENVGGILGRGYTSTSAPNTAGVDIRNCSSDGIITGVRAVGGILGAEDGSDQYWANGPLTIRGNTFSGTVIGQERVGAIIGFLRSMNRNVYVDNNTFSGGEQIGFVNHIDTSAVEFGMHDGTFYFNTANFNTYTADEWAQIYAVVDADWIESDRWLNKSIARADQNRFDDPLGVNGQQDNVAGITISGEFKTEYTVGDTELDFTGMVITVSYNDGTPDRILDPSEVEVQGFNTSEVGPVTVTLVYGSKFASFEVMVWAQEEYVTVTASVMGATRHDPVADGWWYTLKPGDDRHPLIPWGGDLTYEAEDELFTNNQTVWDVLQDYFDRNGIEATYSSDNQYDSVYISALEYNGVKLTEKDNYKESGWMYTVNGVRPGVGVDKTYLKDGDVIVFFWSDDYTKEDTPVPGAKEANIMSTSLNLEGQIGVNFYLKLSDGLLTDENAVVSMTAAGRTEEVSVKDGVKNVKDGVTRYRFTFNVAPKEITELVTLKILTASGSAETIPLRNPAGVDIEGNSINYSVSHYISSVQNSASESSRDLANALAVYGHWAMVYFGYNPINPDPTYAAMVDNAVTVPAVEAADLIDFKPGLTGTLPEGLKLSSTSLNMEYLTAANVKFEVLGEHKISEYTFTCNGQTLTPVLRSGKYCVTVDNIAAKDLDVVYEIHVGDATVKYAALSYAYSALKNYSGNEAKLALCNLVRAMYGYNQAANDYFNS